VSKTGIVLTDEEANLLSKIEFDANRLVGNVEKYRQNAKLVAALSTSLLKRNAIPQDRLRYFTDPDCNPGGRGKSHKDTFERNGTCGMDILRHPHFLNYLRYFLIGASLPDGAMEEFRRDVDAHGPITSGDLMPLADCAKRLTRAYQLEPHDAAEEFLKLALDCGLSPFFAEIIREKVKRIR
jgi:hypothetical protein